MLKAGDVVVLKSGGQPMTVIDLRNEDAVCVWMGEEGDLFRDTLPTLALELAEELEDEDLDDEADEDEAEDEESDESHDDKEKEKEEKAA